MLEHLLHYLGRGFLAVFTKKVTRTEASLRFACCWNCGRYFHYTVQVTTYGLVFRSFSAAGTLSRAERDAERRAQRMLDRAVIPTPCTHCGRYQEQTSRRLRWRAVYFPLGIGFILAALLLVLALQGYGEPGLTRRASWRFMLTLPWNVIAFITLVLLGYSAVRWITFAPQVRAPWETEQPRKRQ